MAFPVWAGLYAVAGFQALSLEIVWFRLLGVMVKSSAFTFGTLLTIYLAGLGAGAAVASLVPRPGAPSGRAFLLLQAFVGLYAGASFFLVSMLPTAPALAPFSAISGATSRSTRRRRSPVSGPAAATASDRAQFFRLYILLPALLVGPPTIAMGASFPLLQKIVLTDLGRIGTRVGTVLLANIAGSAVGSIVTGWIALTYIGSAGSLKLLTATSAAVPGARIV